MTVEPRYLTIRIALRLPRFSLRLLIVVFTAITLLLGYGGIRLRQAHLQEVAVRAIHATGGSVCYTGMFEKKVHYRLKQGGKLVSADGGRWPKKTWLRSVLGRDFFDRVTSVSIGSTNVEPALGNLDVLPSVKHVFLEDTPSQDVLPIHFARLEKLYLKGSSATEELASVLRDSLPSTEITVEGTDF